MCMNRLNNKVEDSVLNLLITLMKVYSYTKKMPAWLIFQHRTMIHYLEIIDPYVVTYQEVDEIWP